MESASTCKIWNAAENAILYSHSHIRRDADRKSLVRAQALSLLWWPRSLTVPLLQTYLQKLSVSRISQSLNGGWLPKCNRSRSLQEKLRGAWVLLGKCKILLLVLVVAFLVLCTQVSKPAPPSAQSLLGKTSLSCDFAERGATSGSWLRWQWRLLAKSGFPQCCKHPQERSQGPGVRVIRIAIIQPKRESIKSGSILVITVDYDCHPCPYVSLFLKRFTASCAGFCHFIAQPRENSGFSEDIAT